MSSRESMIYQDIQNAIEHRYDLSTPCRVSQFVSHDVHLVKQLTGKECTAPEVLLIREASGSIDVTLFLEKALLECSSALDTEHHADQRFNEFCTILEGVSHFVYLVWNAQFSRQIKPIEMELQAEVDKFVIVALAGRHASVGISQRRSLSRNLFSSVRFNHPPGSSLHHRYKVANDLAQRYCNWLSDHYEFTRNNSLLNAELARFYRMNATAKFNHINRQACLT